MHISLEKKQVGKLDIIIAVMYFLFLSTCGEKIEWKYSTLKKSYVKTQFLWQVRISPWIKGSLYISE